MIVKTLENESEGFNHNSLCQVIQYPTITLDKIRKIFNISIVYCPLPKTKWSHSFSQVSGHAYRFYRFVYNVFA